MKSGSDPNATLSTVKMINENHVMTLHLTYPIYEMIQINLCLKHFSKVAKLLKQIEHLRIYFKSFLQTLFLLYPISSCVRVQCSTVTLIWVEFQGLRWLKNQF